MSKRTLLLFLYISFFQTLRSNENNENPVNYEKRQMFGSSYKPINYHKSSSSSSKYTLNAYKTYKMSSYKYGPDYYHPLYSGYMLLFLIYNNILYIELNFMDIIDKQYCKLNHCNILNETTMNTPSQRNISFSEIIHIINNTKNATTLNNILLSNYGCSIDFDQCIISGSSRSFQKIELYMICIFFFFTTLFMNK
jgi:hypothetical protein